MFVLNVMLIALTGYGILQEKNHHIDHCINMAYALIVKLKHKREVCMESDVVGIAIAVIGAIVLLKVWIK